MKYFVKIEMTGVPDRMFTGFNMRTDNLPEVSSEIAMMSSFDEDKSTLVFNVKSVKEARINMEGYTHEVELEYLRHK